MFPNEVKPYTESYRYIWKNRENYQEFRFNVMNMLVDDNYDQSVTSRGSRVRRILLEAAIGFALWTIILTPYVLFVTKMTFDQYISWLVMQAFIVPPVAVIVLRITNWITKKCSPTEASPK